MLQGIYQHLIESHDDSESPSHNRDTISPHHETTRINTYGNYNDGARNRDGLSDGGRLLGVQCRVDSSRFAEGSTTIRLRIHTRDGEICCEYRCIALVLIYRIKLFGYDFFEWPGDG